MVLSDKSWNHLLEKSLLSNWNENKIYNYSDNLVFDFIIDTPPPYPSGRPWHVGAVAHYSQIDMIARSARMMGKKVLFPIGIDRNGLPIETFVEKKHKMRMRNSNRENFLSLCKKSLDELEDEMVNIMRLVGMSGDFDNYYRTDSALYRSTTQSTFVELWNKGLIYLSNRPNNYCHECGTTISDAEVIYENLPSKLIYMKFDVKNSNDNIIIASTRPELLFSCQAIIVNPDDDRYTKYHNEEIIVPIFNKVVKVIPHQSAKVDFGTGAVMVCSYGDQNDVKLFRELKLQEIPSVSVYGKITANGGKYSGLSVSQARRMIIEDLLTSNILLKQEDILHRTPLCERSKTPIEIIPLEEYYLKQLNLIPELSEKASYIKIYPETHRQILINWLNSITIDWPISRRRYYGTEIPVWYCDNCKSPNLPSKCERYYIPWKESPPFNVCKKCGYDSFTGEERIFDTWMDSSITPLFICKYNRDDLFFEKNYPATIRVQSKDIVRTWLYYSLLRSYQLTNEMPWKEAWIMGYGVDEKGEKMSKSKGNVVDPLPLLERYGADAFRFWSASETNLGQDFRYSEDKIKNAQRFLSKFWNICKFILNFEVVLEKPILLHNTDKWILNELSDLVEKVIDGYKSYNFFIPSNLIREFTWNIFADHYIEMVKPRVYSNKPADSLSGIYTLHKCLSSILLLFAPICPFITEYVWLKSYSNYHSSTSIHKCIFPSSDMSDESLKRYTNSIMSFNSYIWNKKKNTLSKETGKPLSLKDSINEIIPSELSLFEDDLKAMHRII